MPFLANLRLCSPRHPSKPGRFQNSTAASVLTAEADWLYAVHCKMRKHMQVRTCVLERKSSLLMVSISDSRTSAACPAFTLSSLSTHVHARLAGPPIPVSCPLHRHPLRLLEQNLVAARSTVPEISSYLGLKSGQGLQRVIHSCLYTTYVRNIPCRATYTC